MNPKKNSNSKIRKFAIEDTDDLIEVWYAATQKAHPFMDNQFLIKEEKNIREIYIPNTESWVYVEKGKILGFISMIGNEIGAIFVRPEWHSRGIGSALLAIVSELNKTLEVEVFKSNHIGRSFYNKSGFTPLKEYLHEETNQMIIRMKLVV